MKRIYLSKNADVNTPTEAERSDFGMARTILGPAWRGDADDAYIAMWERGWVRVVETDAKVFAERYLHGIPVLWAELTPAQASWLEAKAAGGKTVLWNDVVFRDTREGKENIDIDPFVEELDKEIIVPSDAVPSDDPSVPIKTLEDFAQRLAILRPEELAFLVAQITSPDQPAS